MAATRVYVSYDYDHDNDLKNLLVGQARNDDSPFSVSDWSIKEETTNWKEHARKRIRAVDQVVVICGQYTDTATGVGVEVKIAQEEKISYFLLEGRSDKTCKKPTTARVDDKMYSWTWDNLKKLIGGAR